MTEIMLAISMFLGLQNVEYLHNNINMSNLYYKNNDGKISALYCYDLFVPFNDKQSKNYVLNKIKNNQFLNIPKMDKNGVIISVMHEGDLIVKQLMQLQLHFYPIFNIDGNLVVYKWAKNETYNNNYYFTLKCKNFVYASLLKDRLVNKFNLIVKEINLISPGIYEVGVEKIPYNNLLLANMLSEDDGWFDWVQPSFDLYKDLITANFKLEDECSNNIGFTRKLIVKLTYYNSDISITDDMIPVMGRDFFPLPQKDNKFYEFEKLKIRRYDDSNCKVVEIIYPFKYYTSNLYVFFNNVNFRYKLKDKPFTFQFDSFYKYANSHLTKESEIKDIFFNFDNLALENKFAKEDAVYINTSQKYLYIFEGLAIPFLSVVGMFVIFYILNFVKFKSVKEIIKEQEVNVDDLIHSLNGDNWKNNYLMIYEVVQNINNKFGIKESDNKLLIAELNKIFAENATPNFENLKMYYKDFISKVPNV